MFEIPHRRIQIFSHQQNIWIVTNYGEFKSPTDLRREFRKHFKLSPCQLPHSNAFFRVINRSIASRDVSHSKIIGLPRTKIIEKNIDTVKNLIEGKPNYAIFQPTQRPTPFQIELVNTVERYAASLNKDQVITAVKSPRAQACIESDEGAFEYELKYFKKKLNR